MNQNKVLIFQTSPMHTASTFLVNALYGLIDETRYEKIIHRPSGLEGDIRKLIEKRKITIIKCHNTNIDNLIRSYKDLNPYFVCSERMEKNLFIENKYKKYKNVIVFDFCDLNETKNNKVEKIIDKIHDKINDLFNSSLKINKDGAIIRIKKMNELYNKIKNKPFSYIDSFYSIHGSHRNRTD